jgi:hypothetical protein
MSMLHTKSGFHLPFFSNLFNKSRDVPVERLYNWKGKGVLQRGFGISW